MSDAKNYSNGSSSAAYIVAMIGAAVFYIQQSETFAQVVVALLKALVWPAFLVYDVLKFVT